MHQAAAEFLSQPVAAQTGSPLRAAVYSQIAEAIRDGLLKPGSMIPTESEFSADMKVSRTVVREALMLLEEDGLIRARRGVGRFVSDTLPRIGIERIRPFEDVLGGPSRQIEVKRIQVVRQEASEFVASVLGVEAGMECWLWESVLLLDGEAVAHLQENVSAQPVTLGKGPAAPLEIKDVNGATLLASLTKQLGKVAGPGECQISLSQAGTDCAKLLKVNPSDPVLVLNQRVMHGNMALYVATCLMTARGARLSVVQTLQP